MTDPIKTVETDATKVFAETKAEIAKLETDGKTNESKVTGWVAIHHVYIYVALAFVVGSIFGYLLHIK